MRAHFGLPSVQAENVEGKPPIHVKFEIPYFTTSGIQVRFLLYGLLIAEGGEGVRVNLRLKTPHPTHKMTTDR